MSQTTSSTMSKGPHLCLKNMLSKTDIVQLKALAANKLSIRRISELTGFARNTISKYLKGAEPVMKPKSEQARWLQDNRERVRQEFFDSGCNCAVVQRNLQEQGVRIGLRQLQRFSEPLRLQYKAVRKYCRRYETAPGDHMQIDFCEKTVMVNDEAVKIHVFVAVLAFSRRIFAKAYPAENQSAWLDGIESAFFFFKARPRALVCDNTRCLVRAHKRRSSIEWTQAFENFCQYWAVKPIACTPYHPQSKGKVERAVRYVQSNALQGKPFESLQAVNHWLEHWSLTYADERILDDYLKEIRTPRERFTVERQAMMGIKGLPRFVRVREETRKVDAAGLIRVDGNAYLLPRELAQKEVQLLVDDVSIVVTRKARVIAELDKVDSVYKPRVQKESLRPEKLPHLPQIPDPLYCCNNLQRSLDVYDHAVRRG